MTPNTHHDHLHPFYASAIQAGIRPIRLAPYSKSTPDGQTWESQVMTTAEEVIAALSQGFNVGFLLVGKDGKRANPLGVWGLDIDSQAALDRYGDAQFNLMVSRGHAAKRHLFARLADPCAVRHSRLIRNSHDVKLTGIIVGPGSRHKDGGVYQPFQRSPDTGHWVPWSGSAIDWSGLPVVDHEEFSPSSTKLIPLERDKAEILATTIDPIWVFQKPSAGAKPAPTPYTTARGSLTDRSYRSDQFIKGRIRNRIFSRSGDGGRATLLTTIVHLLNFLVLPADTVLLKLMAPVWGESKSWNEHCVDAQTGKPYPWSEHELRDAIHAAYAYVPHYGVIEHQRLQQIKEVMERLWDFWRTLACLPAPEADVPSPSMRAKDLYETFLELYSLEEKQCSYRRFTLAFQKAIKTGVIGLEKIRGGGRKKLRYYRGVSPDLIAFALDLRGTDRPIAA